MVKKTVHNASFKHQDIGERNYDCVKPKDYFQGIKNLKLY